MQIRKTIFQIFAFSILSTSWAQNLIPNGSFEIGDCPFSHVIRPKDFKVEGWLAPDSSTPDYFHNCGTSESGIPQNWAGNQYPVDGEAFVGIYLKKGRYQENLGIKLNGPLIKDSTYVVQFSIANTANSGYLTKEVSIAFSSDPIKLNHILNYDFRQYKFPIPEPENFNDFSWKTKKMTFKATGNETHFYIGPLKNPMDNGLKNKYRVQEEPMLNNASYVFIDNVILVPKFPTITEEPVFEFESSVAPVMVLFDFNKSIISQEVFASLDTIKQFVQQNDLYLLITGSTDSIGTAEYNKRLGLDRANAVKNYLIFTGIYPERIKAISQGEDAPNYTNHIEEYRRLNRNSLIEFYIKK